MGSGNNNFNESYFGCVVRLKGHHPWAGLVGVYEGNVDTQSGRRPKVRVRPRQFVIVYNSNQWDVQIDPAKDDWTELRVSKWANNGTIRYSPMIKKELRDSRHIGRTLKAEVLRRFPFCLKCGVDSTLTMDHIVPISRGGKTILSNLQTLCERCNTKKGSDIADYRT